MITEFYRGKGYTLIETPGGTDGDVDIHLTKHGQYYIVQCKYWKKDFVDVSTVREQFGLLHHYNADKAVIVSSGEFSADAVDFAAGKPIDLIDGRKLNRLLDQRRVARHQSSVDSYLPMVMTVGCFMFLLIFLISDLKSINSSGTGTPGKISESGPHLNQQALKSQGSGSEADVTQGSASDNPPVRVAGVASLGNQKIYTYTYKDEDGVFQTIASPIWLDYEIVDGRLHYSGATPEEKELAALLNDSKKR